MTEEKLTKVNGYSTLAKNIVWIAGMFAIVITGWNRIDAHDKKMPEIKLNSEFRIRAEVQLKNIETDVGVVMKDVKSLLFQ